MQVQLGFLKQKQIPGSSESIPAPGFLRGPQFYVATKDRKCDCALQAVALGVKRPAHAIICYDFRTRQYGLQFGRWNFDFDADIREVFLHKTLNCLFNLSYGW